MAQVTEKDYTEAQNGDAKVRNDFVKAVDLGEYSEFVDGVKYVAKQPTEIWYTPGGTKIEMPSANMMCIGSKIEIYPASFNYGFRRFLSVQIHHEGHHVVQFNQGKEKLRENMAKKYERFRKLNIWNYLSPLIEMPAYGNQIARAKEFDLEEKDIKEIKHSLNSYLGRAKYWSGKVHPFRGFKKDLVKLLCDSPGDKWVRENILN